jgi:hypothetical protein
MGSPRRGVKLYFYNLFDKREKEVMPTDANEQESYALTEFHPEEKLDEYSEVKDSGVRQEFDTGSVRDTRKGKGRFDLMSPFVEKRLARHFENGAVKYGDRNWEKGQPLMRYIDSAKRHINDFIADKLTGSPHLEDHLAAALWNIGGYIHTEKMIKLGLLSDELDDTPKPPKEK